MSDTRSYWTSRGVNRRSALRVAGLGAAAVGLAACGSNDATGDPARARPAVVDSTKGKPGGTLRVYAQNYPVNFNPVFTTNAYYVIGWAHAGLLQHAWGVQSVDPFDLYNFAPDVASALPEQPDDNTLVFKVRPNVKFHNGRALTSEDVKYSIDRTAHEDKSVTRAAWEFFLDSTTTPDKETLVVKTKFPFADVLTFFDGSKQGYMLAKEYEEGRNPDTSMIGVGPFMFASTTTPVSTTFKRHPDYHIKPYPYFDTIEVLTANDPAKRNADFISRQVNMPFRLSTDEAAQMRKDRPDAKELTWEFASTAVVTRADKAPFNDKRVRQALHIAVDRKKIRDGVTSGLGRDDQFFTVSFQKLFGFRNPKNLPAPQAKLWEFNPAEAKKLMAAAGIDKPIEAELLHYDAGPSGQWFPDTAVLLETTWRELGLANVKDDVYPSGPKTQALTQGMFDSMGLVPNNGFPQGPEFVTGVKDQLYWDPVSGRSQRNQGWTNNAQLNALADRQLKQLKIDDRKTTYREMEPIMAEECYINCQSTVTRSFFWDPSIANANMIVVQGSWGFQSKWWFA